VNELRGRSVLLTGASRGIGVFTGRALAERGANLVVTDMHPEQLEATAADLAQMGVKSIPLRADLRDQSSVTPRSWALTRERDRRRLSCRRWGAGRRDHPIAKYRSQVSECPCSREVAGWKHRVPSCWMTAGWSLTSLT
jgi:NADPH:quinone reductase-like Zn-dependent oxidoreductase